MKEYYKELRVWQGPTALTPLRLTLPDSTGGNFFRNFTGHGLKTVVPPSVSVFPPGRISVVSPVLRGIGSEPCHSLAMPPIARGRFKGSGVFS